MIRAICIRLILAALAGSGALLAQEPGEVSAAAEAFEAGRWAQAVTAYRALLAEDRLNGVYWLRIAQAQRALGRNAEALDTLERGRVAQGPEAMMQVERARNLVTMEQPEAAYRALQAADEAELRSLSVLDDAEEFGALRADERFQRIYRSVRRRIFPCETLAATAEFDFWVGTWEVRVADGTLIGRNTITRQDGGCTILEQWQGGGGSSGSSTSFYVPSRDQWRHIWVGSAGTLIDIAGGPTDNGMRMEGTIEYVGLLNSVVAFRGSWTELPDGRVRQLFEEFDIGVNAWQVWFDGYYTRVGPP